MDVFDLSYLSFIGSLIVLVLSLFALTCLVFIFLCFGVVLFLVFVCF